MGLYNLLCFIPMCHSESDLDGYLKSLCSKWRLWRSVSLLSLKRISCVIYLTGGDNLALTSPSLTSWLENRWELIGIFLPNICGSRNFLWLRWCQEAEGLFWGRILLICLFSSFYSSVAITVLAAGMP